MAKAAMLELLGAIRSDIAEIKLDILDMKKSHAAIEDGVAKCGAMQRVFGERLQRYEAGHPGRGS